MNIHSSSILRSLIPNWSPLIPAICLFGPAQIDTVHVGFLWPILLHNTGRLCVPLSKPLAAMKMTSSLTTKTYVVLPFRSSRYAGRGSTVFGRPHITTVGVMSVDILQGSAEAASEI
jgi:hypothetical protein